MSDSDVNGIIQDVREMLLPEMSATRLFVDTAVEDGWPSLRAVAFSLFAMEARLVDLEHAIAQHAAVAQGD